MSRTSPIAFIELPFGHRLDALHCPLCGSVIHTAGEPRPCPHLLFACLDNAAEPRILHAACASAWRETADRLGVDAPPESRNRSASRPATGGVVTDLIRALDRPDLLVLQLLTAEMSPGPAFRTVILGIAFGIGLARKP